MKLVLLKNLKYDFETVTIEDEGMNLAEYIGDEYIQLSEIIDVEFPMLKDVDINAKKIEVIDKDIQKAKAGIELLEQAKAELLAIPDLRA